MGKESGSVCVTAPGGCWGFGAIGIKGKIRCHLCWRFREEQAAELVGTYRVLCVALTLHTSKSLGVWSPWRTTGGSAGWIAAYKWGKPHPLEQPACNQVLSSSWARLPSPSGASLQRSALPSLDRLNNKITFIVCPRPRAELTASLGYKFNDKSKVKSDFFFPCLFRWHWSKDLNWSTADGDRKVVWEAVERNCHWVSSDGNERHRADPGNRGWS